MISFFRNRVRSLLFLALAVTAAMFLTPTTGAQPSPPLGGVGGECTYCDDPDGLCECETVPNCAIRATCACSDLECKRTCEVYYCVA